MQYELQTEENLKKLVKSWKKLGILIEQDQLPIALDFTSHDIFSLTKQDIEIILDVCEKLNNLDRYEKKIVEHAFQVYLNIFKN